MRKILTLLVLCLCSRAMAQAPAIQWQQSRGGPGIDAVSCVQQTSDGGYIACGSSNMIGGDVVTNGGYSDFWVVKFWSWGAMEWQKSYGGSDEDLPTVIRETADGGYIVGGQTFSFNGDVAGRTGLPGADIWLVKISATGVLQWQKTFGCTGYDYLRDVRQAADGSYMAIGGVEHDGGDVLASYGEDDIWLFRVSETGALLWQRSYGGAAMDDGTSICTTTDGGYIIAGGTSSADGDVSINHGGGDYWVARLDSEGVIAWEKSLGGSGYDDARAVIQCADGGYIVAGVSQSTDGDVADVRGAQDIWVVKLSATGGLEWQRSLGSSGDDNCGFSVAQLADGGYVVSGSTAGNDGDVHGNRGAGDAWVVKLTAAGTIAWQECLGGTGEDGAQYVVATTDGGCVVACRSESNDGDVTGNHGDADYWIVKLQAHAAGVQEVASTVIAIAPNPATDKITVSGVDHPTVYVNTMLGQRVAASATSSVSMAALPAGVYLVKVIDDNGKPVYAGRVVKVGE